MPLALVEKHQAEAQQLLLLPLPLVAAAVQGTGCVQTTAAALRAAVLLPLVHQECCALQPRAPEKQQPVDG